MKATLEVSILSAVWNEEEHLDEMIQSVLSQKDVDIELVFSDDGSTDGTLAKLERWARLDSRVIIASKGTKLGKNAAFNKAYEASTKSVVCLLAGDDRLPPGSLKPRIATLAENLSSKSVSWGKLRTFSTDPRYDGLILPRGEGASKSGASTTMTRLLADEIFPIPESLPNEDGWIGFLAEALGVIKRRSTDIYAEYRIHSGNSHPRHSDFREFSERMSDRAEVWRIIYEEKSSVLSAAELSSLRARWRLEEYRRNGQVLKIMLRYDARLLDRLAVASMANPLLFQLRRKFYRQLTGLRSA